MHKNGNCLALEMGINISHENEKYSLADPEDFNTFPKKKSKMQIIVNSLHFHSSKHK